MSEGRGVGVVGGGIVGSAIAYFLKELGYRGPVTVYEPDPTYEQTSTVRSAAAIRQQFNLGINVAMSRFGYEFFAELDKSSQRVDRHGIGLRQMPYLVLAAEGGFERLVRARERQVDVGADVELLRTVELSQRFPWLRTNDLAGATLGGSGEGWFDPRAALFTLRSRAESAGAAYVAAKVVALHREGARIRAVQLEGGDVREHTWVVDAAGRHAAKVAQLAGVELPIEARKRTAFAFTPSGDVPQVVQIVDPAVADRGLYLRPFGRGFMAVTSPPAEDDVEDFGFEPQSWLFDDVIRPALAHRVPGFADVELQETWTGHYEMNILDQNAIIGTHPQISNLLFACGFSGHGVMHAPATGRGIAELINCGRYDSLDLSPFAYERVPDGRRLDDIQPSERRTTRTGL